MMSSRTAFILASIAGFTAVAMGAFGAHAVRDRISAELLAVYDTGSRYHLIHAVAMLAVAGVGSRRNTARTLAMGSFAAGIVVFSGSLYVLALTGERWLGAVTPVGGVLLLAGWASLGIGAWRGERGAVDDR